MTQQLKQRQFPAGSPLANALVVVVGVLVIAVSFVLGLVALVALVATAIVLAAIIGVRVWWLKRKLGAGQNDTVNNNGESATGTEIIEGEFRVVGSDRDRDPAE